VLVDLSVAVGGGVPGGFGVVPPKGCYYSKIPRICVSVHLCIRVQRFKLQHLTSHLSPQRFYFLCHS